MVVEAGRGRTRAYLSLASICAFVSLVSRLPTIRRRASDDSVGHNLGRVGNRLRHDGVLPTRTLASARVPPSPGGEGKRAQLLAAR